MSHERTIDALIKWIERCLFHDDEYNPPTEKDLHVWLKHAKKFKREQNNLKQSAPELLEALAEALYTIHVMEANLTVVWNKQSDATKQIWRDKAKEK